MTDAFQVRVTGDTAVVTGATDRAQWDGDDRMLFSRTYVRTDGRWQLLNKMQFRSPRDGSATQ